MKVLASSPTQKIYGKPRKKMQRAQCKGFHPELCKYFRVTMECYNDRCFRIHLKGTRRKQSPPAAHEPIKLLNFKSKTSYDHHRNLAYNRPPLLLTLPTQHTTATHPTSSQLITTPHQLRNISPLIRLPFHCTLIPHHSKLSVLQPAHRQLLLNPFILLKPLHSHPKHPSVIIPPQSHTPHFNTKDGRQRTTQGGTAANDHTIFLWEVMHNVQQQLNDMMSVMSSTPASWCGGSVCFTTAFPGDSTIGGSPLE